MDAGWIDVMAWVEKRELPRSIVAFNGPAASLSGPIQTALERVTTLWRARSAYDGVSWTRWPIVGARKQ